MLEHKSTEPEQSVALRKVGKLPSSDGTFDNAAFSNGEFLGLDMQEHDGKKPLPSNQEACPSETESKYIIPPVCVRTIKRTCIAAVLILYNVYLGFGIHKTWHRAHTFCEGVKFLVAITVIAYFIIVYPYLKRLLKRPIKSFHRSITRRLENRKNIWRYTTWSLVWCVIVAVLVWDAWENKHRLVSMAGLIALIVIGFGFSKHHRQVPWTQVMWGVLLQILLGFAVLRWNHGRDFFTCLAEKIKFFLGFTEKGTEFVFGYLATGKLVNVTEQQAIITFSALPVIVFFSFFVSILYFYGVMQILVANAGWLLQATIGTTACESVSAAGNIFLGMSEAPLMIRPFLPKMTKSELHSVMASGFATIAGGAMAAYISLGVNAQHLLTASIMSAPAALAFSKLLYPETEASSTQAGALKFEKPSERNALEAAANGTVLAIKLIGNIVANLIAFIAFIYFLNFTLSWFGSIIEWDFLSFEWLLGKLFTPLAFLMGIEWKDCGQVGELIGLKTFLNEFIAYTKLQEVKDTLSERSIILSTYALCGFSNFGSIGITLGSLGSLVPERKGELAEMSLRAMFAGVAACFMTACVAGMLLS